MEGHHIGVLQDIRQIVVFHAHLLDVLRLIHVIGDDLACHWLDELDKLLGDLASAYHANNLSGHLATHKAFHGVVSGLYAGKHKLEVARERHHMRQRKLGDRAGRVCWNAIHLEPEALGMLNVQTIKTGTAHCDAVNSSFPEDVQNRGRQIIIHKHIHGPATRCHGCGFHSEGYIHITRSTHTLNWLQELLDILAGRKHGNVGFCDNGGGHCNGGHC
ncbi:hypothetical protein MT325_m029R [Paramecium bursaria chlorella virus MT325]|uniref:Uncharacterized protein m029R n=1 Tax=Paramecium bursaria Chlorella virus MT325 TaxID=346932 RepID=A7ITA9_PBCVM|nr:hypothetical protein MT325_m029R [Paramecium bursaria chlorella virus MT325]